MESPPVMPVPEKPGIFASVVQCFPMGIMITDPRQADNPIIHANLAFQQQSGYSLEELIGRNPRFLQGADTDPASVAALHNAVKQGRGCRVTLKNYRKDNTPVWIELALTPVFDDKGAPAHFIGIQTDVTDQRYSETIVQSHQRVLDKVSRVESLETVLQLLADGARTLEPALMTSILLVDEENATMVCKAASGLPTNYVHAIDGLPIADSVGTCGTAIFRKQLVISEDLQKDPKWQNFRDIALQANLQACWSQPIITPAGKVLGSIAFYRDTASVPNERQLDLLRENAAHAALLIEKYLTEQALRDINAELEQRVIARSAEAV